MTANKPGDPTTLNRLYGRSKGKKLRSEQIDLVDNLLPQIAVPDEGALGSKELFGDDRAILTGFLKHAGGEEVNSVNVRSMAATIGLDADTRRAILANLRGLPSDSVYSPVTANPAGTRCSAARRLRFAAFGPTTSTS